MRITLCHNEINGAVEINEEVTSLVLLWTISSSDIIVEEFYTMVRSPAL